MAYIKITNGVQEPYAIGKLRRDNKNVSFPKIVPDTILADYGIFEVTTADRPTIDEATQVVTVNTEATQVAGKWTYEWTVRSKTAEELAQQDAALAARVRAERDSLLVASDWTQIADAPVDQAAWATYRQALRDITKQATFPNEVVWPVKPTEGN